MVTCPGLRRVDSVGGRRAVTGGQAGSSTRVGGSKCILVCADEVEDEAIVTNTKDEIALIDGGLGLPSSCSLSRVVSCCFLIRRYVRSFPFEGGNWREHSVREGGGQTHT